MVGLISCDEHALHGSPIEHTNRPNFLKFVIISASLTTNYNNIKENTFSISNIVGDRFPLSPFQRQ